MGERITREQAHGYTKNYNNPFAHEAFASTLSRASEPEPTAALTKSWHARIGEATDAIAQRFVESMSYDWRFYKRDVAGSIVRATIVAGLKQIEAEIDCDRPKWAIFQAGVVSHRHVRGVGPYRPQRRAGAKAAHGKEPE